MNGPLDFLGSFAARLRKAGIRFAITSGMACVHYGLQQTTKDSDWIIAPEDLQRFRALLSRLASQNAPWQISYRAIFGAPLESDYMAHGWTSHLLLREPGSGECKVDLFCKAPRVREVVLDPENPDFAARDVVAQMKRTDRPRDWPIVDGLGWQLLERAPAEALVHLQDAAKLLAVWPDTDAATRRRAISRRPLLRLLEREADPDRLDGYLRLERLIWECVNDERYTLYGLAWKDFYRIWRAQPGFAWPVQESFSQQHERLASAVRRFGLEPDPIGVVGREALVSKALRRAAVKAQTSLERLAAVQPSIEELLP
jgi:hypothetical protein